MNENLMRVLFGAQKQSLKQNVAICNFVEEFLDISEGMSESEIVNRITAELNDLKKEAANIEEWYLSDKLFLQYMLGVNGCNAVMKGVSGTISATPIGENGKMFFEFDCGEVDPETDDKLVRSLLVERSKNSCEDMKKVRSLEDEAYALIKEMLDACPPNERCHLPEDDALAAILFSKAYWAAR